LLEFWDTRCVPCVAAIPHLNELAAQFIEKPVVFLSVTDENKDYVRAFLRRKPIKGWVAIDGALAATRTAFAVEGIPETVIVDATGKIAAITHPSKLKAQHLDEILAGKPCSLPPPEPVLADDNLNVVAVSNLVPRIVEVSVSGPFPRPNGAFNSRGWDESHCAFEAKKAYLRDVLAAFFEISSHSIYEEAKLSMIDANPSTITSGSLPKDLQNAISAEDLQLLNAELAKPKAQQFQPDPAKVINAAREQLGLDLKPAKRKMMLLEVKASSN
jgi:hypothetical protein